MGESIRAEHDIVSRLMEAITLSDSGCWVWSRSTAYGGYGKIKVRGRTVVAHRLSYELFVGPVEKRAHVHHVCVERGFGTRACINPEHLRVVQPKEHKRLHVALQTHCPKGHPYPSEEERAGRAHRCWECKKESQRRVDYRRRRKAGGKHRLTHEQVTAMRREYFEQEQERVTFTEMARRYGVSQQTAASFLKNPDLNGANPPPIGLGA